MQGIAITDTQGRRILATHFPSPLALSLAIDAAVAATVPVVWIPAPGPDSDPHPDPLDPLDPDHPPLEPIHSAPSRGLAVCHLQRSGLRYIAPVARDIDPLIPLTLLTHLHTVLETYLDGPVSEGSLKDNFDVVLALLQEMVAGGRPQLSQAAQLKELVVPPDSQLLKVALNAATAAGITMLAPQTTAHALIASPLPWRRQGIRYASNEIYFDLVETLSYTLSPSGRPLTASISGNLSCRSRLSGMPDLALQLTDPSVLDQSAAFHSCVRYARWKKDRVVSFVPPDGTFPLLSYLYSPTTTTAATTSSASALSLALLPLTLTSTLTHGPLGGTLSLSLTSRAHPSQHPLRNLEVRIPLPRGAHSVQVQLAGGAYRRDEQGRAMGGGAGEWEVVAGGGGGGGTDEGAGAAIWAGPPHGDGAGTPVGGAGAVTEERQTLVWRIDSLGATDRPATLTGQYLAAPDSRKPPAFTLTFDQPSTAFSGLRISSLKVLGEPYSVYKGVKSSGRGSIEVRTS